MVSLYRSAARFFRVVVRPQSYVNLLYLLVAFPLGLAYFILLVSGLASGLSLLVVWVGIPILLLMGAVSWSLAGFERLMAIHWLKEDVPAMATASSEAADLWTRLKRHLANPVTWKSLVYLFLKFPLGLAAFVVLATLLPLTVASIALPILFKFSPSFRAGEILSVGLPGWEVDSLGRALIAGLAGLLLWPVTLHVTNGMAWVHAKFARVMLSVNPLGR
jgi:hypothetical protein